MGRALALVVLTSTIACGDGGGASADSGTDASSSAASTSADAEGTTSATSSKGDTSTSETTGGPEGWTVLAELGVELGMAMSVYGTADTEVRIVGGQDGDGASSGFVLRWDGTALEPEALPEGTAMLNWIGAAGSDLWAVGLHGTALRREDEAWVAHDSGTEVTLWGVWGGSEDEAWAVGGDGVSEPPTLLTWDGTGWSDVPLEGLPRSSDGLFKVWGSDPEHVFVVGDGGVAMRRDAGSWVVDPLEGAGPIISVWGRGADDVIAVGGRANARVLRWNGARGSWTDATLPPAGLNGVWMDDEGAAIAVGRLGGIYEIEPGSIDLSPVDSPTLHLLHAVHGLPSGARFAVGGSFEGPPPWVGVILRHPG